MVATLPNGRRGHAQVTSSLEGRVAIVAGVGPGLGRESALILARHGADVVLGARRTEVLEKVAKEVEALGRRAAFCSTDICDPDQCARLVQVARDSFGRLDILVNNAIMNRVASGHVFDMFEHSDISDWRLDMDVNYWGTLNMTQAAIPAMKESGGGSIVMVNTMYIKVYVPTYGAYVGTKGALDSVTKVIAQELGRDGIRVNAVHPGYIYSDAWEEIFEETAAQRGITADDVYNEFAERTALGYIPPSAEMAGAVFFLASDLSAGMTGQSVHVNGGEYFH